MKIEVKLDTASLSKAVGNIEDLIVRAANQGADTLAQYVVEEARATDKFHMGIAFQEGIQYTPMGTGWNRVTSEVFANGVEYSNFMEYGNQPNAPDGKIHPVHAKALRLSDGSFVAWVSPISEEKLHFFSEAVEKVSQQADNIVADEVNKIVKGQ